MRLYEVEITIRAVVCAATSREAERIAERNSRDIVGDDALDDVSVACEIRTESDLPQGWDVDCLPYGNEDDKTIGDYLDAVPASKDTKTIDMFAGAAQ